MVPPLDLSLTCSARFGRALIPEDGNAVLANESPFEITIDGYSVVSPGGSLIPGNWNTLEDAGVELEVHEMARGLSPGEDIVIFAEDNDIDQIFVGIEKKSRTRKLLLGSTAQYIILKATCPVTTIK